MSQKVKVLCPDCDGKGYRTVRAYPRSPVEYVDVKCELCDYTGFLLMKRKDWE